MKQVWDFRNKKERLSSKNSCKYKITGNEVMWNKNVTKDEQHYQVAFRNKKKIRDPALYRKYSFHTVVKMDVATHLIKDFDVTDYVW